MIDGIPNVRYTCDICEREPKRAPGSREILTGSRVAMCNTCWAIWYDGQTDPVKIKAYSLKWPTPDNIGAYATNNEEDIIQSMKIREKFTNESL